MLKQLENFSKKWKNIWANLNSKSPNFKRTEESQIRDEYLTISILEVSKQRTHSHLSDNQPFRASKVFWKYAHSLTSRRQSQVAQAGFNSKSICWTPEDCYWNGQPWTGNDHGELGNEKWKQNRELEMKLLIRLGFNLGFLPIFHFPVRRARFPLPVLRLSNIQNPDERL